MRSSAGVPYSLEAKVQGKGLKSLGSLLRGNDEEISPTDSRFREGDKGMADGNHRPG
jgi:hypothetical protein